MEAIKGARSMTSQRWGSGLAGLLGASVASTRKKKRLKSDDVKGGFTVSDANGNKGGTGKGKGKGQGKTEWNFRAPNEAVNTSRAREHDVYSRSKPTLAKPTLPIVIRPTLAKPTLAKPTLAKLTLANVEVLVVC